MTSLTHVQVDCGRAGVVDWSPAHGLLLPAVGRGSPGSHGRVVGALAGRAHHFGTAGRSSSHPAAKGIAETQLPGRARGGAKVGVVGTAPVVAEFRGGGAHVHERD